MTKYNIVQEGLIISLFPVLNKIKYMIKNCNLNKLIGSNRQLFKKQNINKENKKTF